MKTKDIFLSNESIAIEFIKSYEYPHLILPNIKNIVLEIGERLNDEYEKIGEDIWIHKTAKIPFLNSINRKKHLQQQVLFQFYFIFSVYLQAQA